MATSGSKTGAPKAVAPKTVKRAPKTPAPQIAVPKAEKPVPVEPVAPLPPAPAETKVVAAAVEPVPVEAHIPQDEIEITEAVIALIFEEEVAEPAAILGEAVAQSVIKEARKVETMIEANTQKAQAFFADFNDRTKAAVEKSTKLVEEANEFAKGNVEAFVESGKIAAKGLEAFGQDAAEYSRKSFESATATLKTLATVKSPTELFKLQSDFFRTAFDSYVAEASKNTEAMLKLAGDAAQPLSSRVALAVEKAKLSA